MGKCAVFPILINLQIPDNCGEQNYRRLHKEISLFLYPRAVQIHHNGICRFVGVGYIRHKSRVYRITPVGMFRIIEIYDVKFRFSLAVTLLVILHVIIRN